MNKAFILALCFFSSFTYSQWFESSGEAFIVNDNVEQARENAIKNAVKNALIFSGGTISSLQQVNNGILTGSELILNSEGEIKGLKIIAQNKTDKLIKVNINVDIEPKLGTCLGKKYPKSLSLTRFKLNVPLQAVVGDISRINQVVTKTLYNQLNLSATNLNVRRLLNSPLKLGEQYNNADQLTTLSSVAQKTDSQFIIYGEIDDLSVKFDAKDSFSYWFVDPKRNFYITIYIYDALQGELISANQYRTKAKWEYDKYEKVDLSSKLFWEMKYGQAILSLLNEITEDLEIQLECLESTAKIVSVDNNSVQINLGSRNGIKLGDTVTLSYSNNHKDQFGISRNAQSKYQGKMKAIQVNATDAILTSEDEFPLENIQINDLAHIK